jgi:hypothetical protein
MRELQSGWRSPVSAGKEVRLVSFARTQMNLRGDAAYRSATRRVLLLVALPVIAAAQRPTSEVWPELDIYWTPAEHQRSMLELSGSTEREGSKREATVGLYQDYLRLPAAFFRGGFRYTFSTRDASYRESRIVLEANMAAYSGTHLRFVNRIRTELRLVNGEYSYRVRERLHFQRAQNNKRGRFWAPYGTVEGYYDSKYNTVAKIGGRIGTEGHIRGPLGFDVFIARQENSRTLPKSVNALGLVAKLNY